MYKTVGKVVLGVFAMFFCLSKVQAECDLTEENRLSSLAANVRITYEYEEEFVDEVGMLNAGSFMINISGLTEELYVIDDITGYRFLYANNKDGIVTIDGFPGGDRTLSIYGVSATCHTFIKKVTLNIPKFNYYAIDERCEGIDPKEFALCDRWYQYNINEELFTNRYEEYLKNKDKVTEDKPSEEEKEETWMEKTMSFIEDNVVFVVAGGVLLIGIIIYLIVRFRRKRNELV